MNNKKYLIILMFSVGFLVNGFGQTDGGNYGCKYIKSKIKMAEITDAEQHYAEELTFRSDTYDIVNYRIKLDVTNFSTKVLVGQCDIDFSSKMDSIDYIRFDLLNMTVDSVKIDTTNLAYTYKSPFVDIKFDSILSKNDTIRVSIFYHGISIIDPSGFGGFYFEKGYAYNLGVGLSSIPHNYGRAWFPCFDNFVERSTYDLDIITKPSHTAYCIGKKLGVDTLDDHKKIFHYRMDKQIPTYLVGVAVSDYREVNWDFEGLERHIPIQLVCNPQDTNSIKTAMAYVPFAIEALEDWFGPYEWSRVGYVLTSHGAMEHPTNIAFPDFLGKDGDPENAMGTMSHELAHHWWGDITTLTTAFDMWIKEGTSEYGSHLFMEHFFGEERFKKVVKANQSKVINFAHFDDDGFWPLSGMPMNHTYGTTTYNKGAAVFHNLRTYMGDSLFKKGMRSILTEYRFSHLDADQFEKQLEANTGLDLSCFFDDWIYSSGFSSFEIDSVVTTHNNGDYQSTVYIEQKLYHAPHFHCNVPLEVSFYNDNHEKLIRNVIASDQFSNVSVSLPFRPVYWTINENQKLNNGQLNDWVLLKSNSTSVASFSKISFKSTKDDADSIKIYAEHVWGAPDAVKDKDKWGQIKISKTHFWNIYGDFPEDNQITASFFYGGKKEFDLDYALTHNTEDSIVMLFRKDSKHDWELFENFKKQRFSPKDGNGRIKLTGIKSGQYCFANAEVIATKIDEYDKLYGVFPNPARDFVNIDLGNEDIEELYIYSVFGTEVYKIIKPKQKAVNVNIKSFIPGIYFVKTIDTRGKVLLGNFEVE